ncbi:tyrosine-type recombinase/integrase [Streptosporangium sandarakinum]|uniref:tyrosine-type recombinase/integrase n=1 Tax=Streptosporangium sandarakinum TaxID=1260955 RepID=UPI0037AF9BC7
MPVAGITIKPYRKSRAGCREVPLPGFAVDLLTRHRAAFPAGPLGEVFTGRSGNLMSRHTFRAHVWWPSLVRAGLLGSVTDLGDSFLGTWTDKTGTERRKRFPTREEAVSHLAQHAGERLRFHDLRHCYATWLVSERAPVNDVAGLIEHEQISTTLNRYTHASRDRGSRARAVFADFSLNPIVEKAAIAEPSISEEPTA